jgi:RimJ/RimL family protein N-acetyltransferase
MPEVMRYIPGGVDEDLNAVRRRISTYRSQQAERGFSSWALVERASGRLIGDVGFGVFEPTGDLELGYSLAQDRWGLGYATEAAAACLRVAFEHLEVPRLIAVVDAENEASLRVPERIGMRRAEEVKSRGRPHVLFATSRG